MIFSFICILLRCNLGAIIWRLSHPANRKCRAITARTNLIDEPGVGFVPAFKTSLSELGWNIATRCYSLCIDAWFPGSARRNTTDAFLYQLINGGNADLTLCLI